MAPQPIALARHFRLDGVLELQSTDKFEALRELCAATESHTHVLGGEAFQRAIFDREKLVSTGIGIGVAVPHVKIASVTD